MLCAIFVISFALKMLLTYDLLDLFCFKGHMSLTAIKILLKDIFLSFIPFQYSFIVYVKYMSGSMFLSL